MSIYESDTNPYVGPSAFQSEQEHLFFGRNREAKKLLSLIRSTDVALFYAPSGAGKTSLINARIIPALKKKGVEVLPVARVGGEVSSELEPRNIYVFNALSYLSEQDKDPSRLERLQETSFREFFMGNGERRPRVVILDQFEEIVTMYPERHQEREEFFQQVREALETVPLLSVVFSMKEDHIAALDRYSPLLPDRLRGRFRMERLRHDAAVMAIRQPAENQGRPFDEAVAENLVCDLRLEKVAGQEPKASGEFVEPVYLQVVCFQLWESLKGRSGQQITQADLEAFGNVDRALESFYEEAVVTVAQRPDVSELRIRRWFGETLITPSRLRSQISRNAEDTGGLPNEVVDQLEDKHLIRADKVRGGTWFELVHDRMIDPILEANEKWMLAEAPPLTVDAREWQAAAKNNSFLYRDQKLAKWVEWARANRGTISELEQEFLDEAENAQRDRRKMFLAVGLGFILSLVLLVVVGTKRRAQQSAKATEAAFKALEGNPLESLRLIGNAVSLMRSSDQSVSPAAEAALHRALYTSRGIPVWSDHVGEVSIVSLSADGTRLVTAQADHRVKIWSTESGRKPIFQALKSRITALAISPDNKYLAAFNYDDLDDLDNTVEIWGIDSRKKIFASKPRPSTVNTLAFSQNGKFLAMGSEDTTVEVWNVDKERTEFRLTGHDAPILSLEFDSDGRYLATACEDGVVNVWDTESGQGIHDLSEHKDAVFDLDFSSDGMKLVTGGLDSTVKVWDVDSGEMLSNLKVDDEIKSVAFSPDGRHVITVTFEGIAQIWNLRSSQEESTLTGVSDQASVVALGQDGTRLGVIDSDGSASLWEIVFDDMVTLATHKEAVRSVAFSPDGKRIVTASEDGTVKISDLNSTATLLTVSPNAGRVNSVTYSPDGKWLATATDDDKVRIWDSLTGDLVKALGGHTDLIRDVAFSEDGTKLAAVSDDGTVRLWDIDSERLLKMLEDQGKVTAVVFQSDGKRLAIANENGSAMLWDVESTRPTSTFSGHEGAVNAVTFSPDGSLLATASADSTAKLWKIDTTEPPKTLSGHKEKINDIAFSPDGRRLATCSLDTTTKMWDVQTGKELFELPGHTDTIHALAFSPDGKLLVTASEDGTVRVERLDIDDLIRLAEERTEFP